MKSAAERRRRIRIDLVRIQLAGLLAGLLVPGLLLLLHFHSARHATQSLEYHSRAIASCGQIGSELASIEGRLTRLELASNDPTIEPEALTLQRDRQHSAIRASMDLIDQSHRELEELETRSAGPAFTSATARVRRAALELEEAGGSDSLTSRSTEIEALLIASQQLSMLHSIAETDGLRVRSAETRTLITLAALFGAALLLFVISTSQHLHRSVYGIVAGRELAYETLDRQRQRLQELLDQKTHLVERLETADTELRDSREQLRQLAVETRERREDDRSRFSKEIRDRLGQVLTSLKLDLGWVASRLPEGAEARACGARIDSMSDLIDDSLISIRQLASELRPALLDDLGLIAAMEWQAREFTRETGCDCQLSVETLDLEREPHRDTALFRIFQAALSEIARDASSQSVEISLRTSDHQLEMNIECDGASLSRPPATGEASLWLRGIQERALELGGRLRSHTADQVAGNCLSVQIPIAVGPSRPAPSS